MDLILDLQLATEAAAVPSGARLEHWARAALDGAGAPDDAAELTVRIVGAAEGAALNEQYRGRPGPTNVLSFPFEPPPGFAPEAAAGEHRLLGDLVICAPVIAREAGEQGKSVEAHWAHMVVHGVLHLLGHDHQASDEAERMEALETAILCGLGFPPPYEVSPEDSRHPHDERSI